MRALRLIAYAVMICLAAVSCKKEIPITEIEISEEEIILLPGETKPVSITYKPENATNLDQLVVVSSNENLVHYADGTVTGIAPGTASVRATCGEAFASCWVKVLEGYFKKGGQSFVIDQITGYHNYESEPTMQSIEIIFTQRGATLYESENLQLSLRSSQLGQMLDFTKPLSGPFVSTYTNNNENGYIIFSSDDGNPTVRLADWSDADGVTLTKGEMKVEKLGTYRYKVHMDFMLSNGYGFGVDWEGNASMKETGKI